ncbi:hypothetical protein CWE13_07410 [Aliidiomarina shirensis]|uniref:Uncharacterized protein n=1 Tax=Aliidiomarina shirensis TaxID=1048642 RepID=A0A432WVG5_9GAMM|nr:hypothetical protein [Aliidiomarina shirensis]RUO37764.1 hypothetical protein CWE13_07410 [Aliidiomarina shirensis]
MQNLKPQTEIRFDFDLTKPLREQCPYESLGIPELCSLHFPYPFSYRDIDESTYKSVLMEIYHQIENNLKKESFLDIEHLFPEPLSLAFKHAALCWIHTNMFNNDRLVSPSIAPQILKEFRVGILATRRPRSFKDLMKL